MADEIVTVFRLDEAAKMLKIAGVLLYRRVETVLWWFGSFKRPKMGDRMRDRENRRREERDAPRLCYGVNACMVYLYR